MKGIIRKGSRAENRLREVYIDIYDKMETGNLKGLTLSDVQCLCELGKKLVEKGVASTVIKSVADYYKSFGFMVTMDFNNINYVIVA
jgi:hypothetical protein